MFAVFAEETNCWDWASSLEIVEYAQADYDSWGLYSSIL